GETKDVTANATWSSSDPSIATVTSGGLLSLLQQGTCIITAVYQGVSSTWSVSGQIVTTKGTIFYTDDFSNRDVIALYATPHDNSSWGSNLVVGGLTHGKSFSMPGVGTTQWDVRVDYNGTIDGTS